MIHRHGFVEDINRWTALCCVLTAYILYATTALSEQLDKTNNKLLNEDEYRIELEEVVVQGKQPQWREPKQEQWRPERFQLPKDTSKLSRIQWLPEYNKDERDFYQGVRDRVGEKAEFKLFEWKF